MIQGEFFENGEADRRRDTRTTAVYRPVLLETEGFTGFCQLRNLSPSGMMGEAYAQFIAGEEVSIQFMPGHVVTGSIVWSRDGLIGVQFDDKIDLVGSLQNVGGTYVQSRPNRALRLQIECTGEAVVGDTRLTIRVQDISQRGMKAIFPNARPGDEVLVCLPGMEPRKGLIRWSQNDIAGLNFLRPIGFEELARWAIGQQAENARKKVSASG